MGEWKPRLAKRSKTTHKCAEVRDVTEYNHEMRSFFGVRRLKTQSESGNMPGVRVARRSRRNHRTIHVLDEASVADRGLKSGCDHASVDGVYLEHGL